jgi:thioesterase domain-containing protein
LYGLRARGLDGVQEPLATIEEMAAHYLGEVRTLQPEGPYYLGGYSAGGTVAFEMARQLAASGQEVALLAMIDSRAKSADRATRSLGYRLKSWLRGYIFVNWLDQVVALGHRFGRKHTDASSTRLDAFVRMGSRRRREIHESFGELRKLSIPGASPNIDKIVDGMAWLLLRDAPELLHEHHRRVIGAFCRALVAYTPGPYSGRVDVFRSSKRSQEGDLGWGKLVAGGVGVREVIGRHGALLRERHVHHLAGELTQRLEEAQARSGGPLPARDRALAQPDGRTHEHVR